MKLKPVEDIEIKRAFHQGGTISFSEHNRHVRMANNLLENALKIIEFHTPEHTLWIAAAKDMLDD